MLQLTPHHSSCTSQHTRVTSYLRLIAVAAATTDIGVKLVCVLFWQPCTWHDVLLI